MPSFVVVPQWQGSGSSRALRLRDGAQAILGDLPQKRTKTVSVPLGVGDAEGSGVRGLSALRSIRSETQATLAGIDDVVITVGGDCGVDLAAIPHALRRRRSHTTADGTTAVVWLGAHPDLNTPAASRSGAFHGMVLRTLLGEGPADLLPPLPLQTEQVVLAGTRALDDAEAEYVEASGIRMLAPADLTVDSLLGTLTATGADSVYLHIDLDVLDPGEFLGIGFPEPFGLTPAALIELIRAAGEHLPLAGAAVTEFAPASAEQAENDLPTILRILGALSERSTGSASLA